MKQEKDEEHSDIRLCDSACMQRCMNCRVAVEESLTRVRGRKMRAMRNLPECSIERCVDFLSSVEDKKIRFHLAAMAWWRFSSDSDDAKSDAVRGIMVACGDSTYDPGMEYLHTAVRILSPLSQEQLTTWFGFNNLYQMARLFAGEPEAEYGPKCMKCAMFKSGCDMYDRITAKKCQMFNDKFMQDVAAAIKKSGGWRDPCGKITCE